jgi:hypothetical protein
MKPVGAPNSAARWLSENIGSIPGAHKYALMRLDRGVQVLVVSGSMAYCVGELTDDTREVVCSLDKYRDGTA